MPDMADIVPPSYGDPRAEAMAEKLRAQARTPDWLTTEAAAVNTSLIESSMGRWWTSQGFGFEPDPNFHMDRATLEEATKDIPTDRISVFAHAHSEDHLLAIRADELRRMESLQTLHDAGLTGTLTGIGVGLTDPISLAAMVLTGGASTAAQVGGQVGRMALAARAGLVMGTTMAGLETFNAAIDPSVSGWDIAKAGAGGFGFGAAGKLTASAGRAVRFGAVGAGQAIPSTAVGLLQSGLDENATARDAIYSGMFSFGVGGALGAIHGKVADAAMKVRKEIEVQDIVNTTGVDSITTKGKTYYKDVADPKAQEQTVIDTLTPAVEMAKPVVVGSPVEEVGPLPHELFGHSTVADRTRIITDDAGLQQALAKSNQVFKQQEGSIPKDSELAYYGAMTEYQRANPDAEVFYRRPGTADEWASSGNSYPTKQALYDAIQKAQTDTYDPYTTLAHIVNPDGTIEVIKAPDLLPGRSLRGETRREAEAWAAIRFVDKPATIQDRVADLFQDGWDSKDAIAQAELEARNAGAEIIPRKPAEAGAVSDAAGTPVPVELKNTEPPQPSPAPAEGASKAKEPSHADQLLMFADKLEKAAKASRAKAQIPRGPNVGAAIDPIAEVRDIAKIILAKSIRTGVHAAEDVRKMVQAYIEENAPHLIGHVKDIHRMVTNVLNASMSTDGRLLPDRLPDAVGPNIDRAAMHKPGMYDLTKVSEAPIAYARLMKTPLGEMPYTPRGWSGAQRIATDGKDPTLRHAAKMLGASGMLVDKAGVAAHDSPAERSAQVEGQLQMEWRKVHDDAFTSWMQNTGKDPGLNPLERERFRKDFNSEVSKAVRREPGQYSSDPAINGAADAFRARREADLVRMQEAGVGGANNITREATYAPRIPLLTAFNKFVNKFGAEAVYDFWARAFTNFDPQEDPEITRLMGQGYWEIVRRSKLGQNETADPVDLSGKQLKDILKKVFPTVSDAKIDQAIYRLTDARDAGSPSTNPFKQRASMDETFAMDVAGKDGQMHKLSVEDFLENDASILDSRSSRFSVRRAAVAEMLRAYNLKNGLSEYGDNNGALTGVRSPQEMVAQIRAVMERDVTTTAQQKIVDSDIKTLEELINDAQGGRLTTDTPLGDAARWAKLYQVLRLGGGIGLKHTSQFAGAVAETTFPSLLRQMPTLARIVTPFASAEWRMSEPLLAEAERLYASRFDPRFNETFSRGFADSGDEASNSLLYQRLAKPTTYLLNRLNFLNYFSRSLAQYTAVMVEQKWLDTAFSGKIPSDIRLKGAGIEDRAMAERITKSMRDHATFSEGWAGRRLRLANVNEWADQEAASAYASGIARTANRILNVPQLAQQGHWMTTDIGSIIAQFKRWPMTAWDNIAMYNVQQFADGDVSDKARVVANIGLAMGFGALGYAGKTYLSSIGRKDRDKFVKENMTPGRVAAHSFADSGFMGFAPEGIDMAAYSTGFKQPFSPTSQPPNPVTDFPMANTAVDAQRAIRGAANIPRGKFSRQDADAMRKMIPFANSNLFYQFFQATEQGFPEERRRIK